MFFTCRKLSKTISKLFSFFLTFQFSVLAFTSSFLTNAQNMFCIICLLKRERQRERKRERKREKEKEIQIEIQTETETETERERVI
jgi:hypothetical protein